MPHALRTRRPDSRGVLEGACLPPTAEKHRVCASRLEDAKRLRNAFTRTSLVYMYCASMRRACSVSFVLGLVALTSVSSCSNALDNEGGEEDPPSSAQEILAAPAPTPPHGFSHACEAGDHVTIAAVDDVHLHSLLQKQAYCSGDGFRSLWRDVEPYLPRGHTSEPPRLSATIRMSLSLGRSTSRRTVARGSSSNPSAISSVVNPRCRVGRRWCSTSALPGMPTG